MPKRVDLPHLSKKSIYELGDLGFKEDRSMGAYVKYYNKPNGDYGCITIANDKVSYILRNAYKRTIRKNAIPCENGKEFRAAIKSAIITMDAD